MMDYSSSFCCVGAGNPREHCGRQLFVDDYLIAETNGVIRYWNNPMMVELDVTVGARRVEGYVVAGGPAYPGLRDL